MVTFFDPGQMTARLDLEVPEAEPDGQGGATVTWTVAASLWARIEPRDAPFVVGEMAAAKGAKVTHRIWVRHRSDIAAGHRLRKGERVFSVKLVHDPDETARYLVCQCEEVAR